MGIRCGFSRGCASGPGWSERSRSGRRHGRGRLARSSVSATSRRGSSTPSTRSTRPPTASSPTATRSALIPPVSGGAFLLSEEPLDPTAAIAEVPTTGPAQSPRSSARRASSRAAAPSTTSTTRPTAAWPRRSWRSSPTSLKAKHDLCAVAIHHRVGRVDIGGISVVIAVSAAAPGGRARRLRRGDRHAQGDGAALEEGGLRGRRGVDRAGLLAWGTPGSPTSPLLAIGRAVRLDAEPATGSSVRMCAHLRAFLSRGRHVGRGGTNRPPIPSSG